MQPAGRALAGRCRAMPKIESSPCRFPPRDHAGDDSRGNPTLLAFRESIRDRDGRRWCARTAVGGVVMLPTFRLMLAATAVVTIMLMVAARGLVAYPEAVTRIGEVPTVSRSLLQLSVVPHDAIQHRLRLAANPLPASDADDADEVGAIAAAPPSTSGTAAEATAAPSLPLVAADERGVRVAAPRSADPLGDLIRAVVPETPEPAPRDAADFADHEAAVEAADDTVQRLGAGMAAPAAAPAVPESAEPVALGFVAEAAARPPGATPAGPEAADATAAVAALAPAVAPAAAVQAAKPVAKPATRSATRSKRVAKPAPRKPPKPRVVYRTAPPQVPAATATHDLIFPTYGPFGTTTTPAAGSARR